MTKTFNIPIKLNLLSIKEDRILIKYILIGDVPKNIKLELTKIEKSGKLDKKNKYLKKYYGKNWYKILGLDFMINRVSGGDEFDFLMEEDSNSNTKKTKESQISIEEIESIINASDEIDLPEQIDNVFTQNDTSQVIKPSDKTQIKFLFDDLLAIYSKDKISELKKKIYVITKIPIYRQHIWFNSEIGTLPLSYNIYSGDSPVFVNIQSLSNLYEAGELKSKKDQVDNIPINMDIYNFKERIKVESYENFKLIEEYTKKYGITEFNIADLNEFIPIENAIFKENISKNKQYFNLLYYGFIIIYWPMLTETVFRDYLKGESYIKEYYPDLHAPYENIKELYKFEKKIMDNLIDLSTSKHRKDDFNKINSLLKKSIISTTMVVSYSYNMKENLLFSRNLFDAFELNEEVDACKCFTSNNNKNYILNKVYKNSDLINETMVSEGIIFRINPKNNKFYSLLLIIYKNGNYVIKSKWREDLNFGFDEVYKNTRIIISPVIEKINSLHSYSLNEGKKISNITEYNYKFTEISINLYYQKTFTESQFALLKFIMEEYKNAGIIVGKNIEKNFAEYYFRKGMYKFDSKRIEKISNITNYYEHLSDGIIKQKWFTIFEKTRITKVIHRFSDVKVEIYGLREEEFNIFYNTILSIFSEFENRKSKIIKDYEFKKLSKKRKKKTLLNLKEQDPILYNLKKVYNTDVVYSRICQKTYQPLLLNKEAYNKLSEDKKNNVVKYWNFTTETDAYYKCPNPDYPYIKFTTGVHPKNYCIPCCKKNKISDDLNDPKRIIHDICLKENKYSKAKKTITIGSKYIMTFGKDIEVGRLSKLPENSMEGIFYETFSMRNEIGSNSKSNGFYLYGVNQNTSSVNDVGYIYCLSHSMDMNIYQCVEEIVKKMKTKKNIFNILLKGKIYKFFANEKDLISQLIKVFGNPKSGDFVPHSKIPWNDIFMELAFNYLDVNTILFQYKKNINDVDLILPDGLDDVNDFILKSKKNLIIVKKGNIYNPVYLVNTDLFFKLGLIEKKLFQTFDSIIIIIRNIIEKYIQSIKIKGKTYSKINLTVIKEFLKDEKNSKKFSIKKLFINNSNFCYYIQLYNNYNKNNIFIPIEQSHYSFDFSPELEFESFYRKDNKQTIETLLSFINEFNRWVDIQLVKAQLHKETDLYSKIRIENWLVLQKGLDLKNNDKIIGFKSLDLNYYFSDISQKEALIKRKVKFTPLFYDPDIINDSINKKLCPKKDPRTKNIYRQLYKYNKYQIFLLEFLRIIRRKRNETLRKKIKKLFIGNFSKDMKKINKSLIEFIDNGDDLFKIRMQISDYINNHQNRKKLYMNIDNTLYNFDSVIINKMINMEKKSLINEIKRLMKDTITIGNIDKIKDFEFPNMITSCRDENEKYCKNNKLILCKKKYDDFVEILSTDILNPLKQKWIFSDIMSDRVINFLRFIRRPDEEIFITLVT